jgi:hypothetical protein
MKFKLQCRATVPQTCGQTLVVGAESNGWLQERAHALGVATDLRSATESISATPTDALYCTVSQLSAANFRSRSGESVAEIDTTQRRVAIFAHGRHILFPDSRIWNASPYVRQQVARLRASISHATVEIPAVRDARVGMIKQGYGIAAETLEVRCRRAA